MNDEAQKPWHDPVYWEKRAKLARARLAVVEAARKLMSEYQTFEYGARPVLLIDALEKALEALDE